MVDEKRDCISEFEHFKRERTHTTTSWHGFKARTGKSEHGKEKELRSRSPLRYGWRFLFSFLESLKNIFPKPDLFFLRRALAVGLG